MLLAGGWNGFGSPNYLSNAETYDVATGTWTWAASMATARGYHAAARLANGKVLVAGGQNSSGKLSSAEAYTP